jgi:hypothetical protein
MVCDPPFQRDASKALAWRYNPQFTAAGHLE